MATLEVEMKYFASFKERGKTYLTKEETMPTFFSGKNMLREYL